MSGFVCRANFEYNATKSDQLTLRKGDFITNVFQKGDGWWTGTHASGKKGMFPSNFVQYVSATEYIEEQLRGLTVSSNIGFVCRVTFDYTATQPDQLTLKKGEYITNVFHKCEGWWTGIHQSGKQGIFPCNFVQHVSKLEKSGGQDIGNQPSTIRAEAISSSQPSAPSSSNFHVSNPQGNCLVCRDFAKVDAHAAKYPRHTVQSIPSLAKALTSQFPSKTDKARAIFIWLHHNIAYNTEAYFSNNVRSKTPEETLRTGLAVCQGYAELFSALSAHSGLEAVVVSGHGKGYGFSEIQGGTVPAFSTNHAWNAVRFDDGEWRLVDACWGAGTVDRNKGYTKSLNVNRFTSPPEQFRLDHFPKDPKYQHCSTTMAWKEYIMMKNSAPTIYTSFDEKGFSRETVRPAAKRIPPGWTKFIITTKCKHLSVPPRRQYVLLLSVDGDYKPFQVDTSNKTWTCEYNLMRSGSQVNVYYLQKLDGVDAIGVGIDGYLRAKNRKAMNYNGLCMWEVS